MYIYGCGNLFQKKYDGLKKQYRITEILDNYKEGHITMDDGEQISITKPDQIDNQIPIVIMREDFIGAWRELRDKKLKNPIVFSCTIHPFTEIDQKLFSDGQRIYEEKDCLLYKAQNGKEYQLNEYESIYVFMHELEKEYVKSDALRQLDIRPYNRDFGFSRGTPVDRWYMENWLWKNRQKIKGDVLEIAEDTYTRRYGKGDSYTSHVLHVEPIDETVIVGNLETGQGIIENSMDCMILTQTLGFIYDFDKVLDNVYKMLREGGVALITTGGISQVSRYDMDRWGHYWWFTSLALKKMVEASKFHDQYSLETFGNVKVACALLYGMAAEELTEEELRYKDEDYEVLHCLKLEK